tara:strand:+ start:173 stop:328 length:156 start_codon:yes stop_codon:yes gene_type:complete
MDFFKSPSAKSSFSNCAVCSARQWIQTRLGFQAITPNLDMTKARSEKAAFG